MPIFNDVTETFIETTAEKHFQAKKKTGNSSFYAVTGLRIVSLPFLLAFFLIREDNTQKDEHCIYTAYINNTEQNILTCSSSCSI